mmetsp:Transcript_19850/g.46359  ORF Transcript_19850/g.46359 Transcript_19850/m.46359 type:complete len:214 (-) Transcript_19850:608-1249(-)
MFSSVPSSSGMSSTLLSSRTSDAAFFILSLRALFFFSSHFDTVTRCCDSKMCARTGSTSLNRPTRRRCPTCSVSTPNRALACSSLSCLSFSSRLSASRCCSDWKVLPGSSKKCGFCIMDHKFVPPSGVSSGRFGLGDSGGGGGGGDWSPALLRRRPPRRRRRSDSSCFRLLRCFGCAWGSSYWIGGGESESLLLDLRALAFRRRSAFSLSSRS